MEDSDEEEMVNGVEGISLKERPTWGEEDMAVVGPCLRLARVRDRSCFSLSLLFIIIICCCCC